MCKGWDLPRGFPGKGARHMKRSKNYQERQGLGCKTTFSFLWTGHTGATGGGRRRPWWFKSPAVRGARVRPGREIEGGGRGEFEDVLTGVWRSTELAGICRSTRCGGGSGLAVAARAQRGRRRAGRD
jgi:hypothetical protein